MKKIPFIIFLISFIPYVVLLGYGLYSAIFGYGVYTWILPAYVETLYGLDAFLEAVTVLGLTLLFVPLLPICLLYQVIFVAVKLILKFKNTSKQIKTEQTESED